MHTAVTEESANILFQLLLGRDRGKDEWADLIDRVSLSEAGQIIIGSLEFAIRRQHHAQDLFFQYNSQIDVIDIVLSHEDKDRQSVEGRLVN